MISSLFLNILFRCILYAINLCTNVQSGSLTHVAPVKSLLQWRQFTFINHSHAPCHPAHKPLQIPSTPSSATSGLLSVDEWWFAFSRKLCDQKHTYLVSHSHRIIMRYIHIVVCICVILVGFFVFLNNTIRLHQDVLMHSSINRHLGLFPCGARN